MDFARRLNWDAGKAVAHGLRRATASDLQAYSLRDIKEMSVAVLGVKPSGTKDALIALIVAAGVPAGVAFRTSTQTKRARLLGWGGSGVSTHSHRPTLLAAADAASESAARRRSENVHRGTHGVGAASTTYHALLAKAKRITADTIMRKEQGDAGAFATREDAARISRERVESMTDVCCVCQVPVRVQCLSFIRAAGRRSSTERAPDERVRAGPQEGRRHLRARYAHIPVHGPDHRHRRQPPDLPLVQH